MFGVSKNECASNEQAAGALNPGTGGQNVQRSNYTEQSEIYEHFQNGVCGYIPITFRKTEYHRDKAFGSGSCRISPGTFLPFKVNFIHRFARRH